MTNKCDFCQGGEANYFYDYLFFCEECWEKIKPLDKTRQQLLSYFSQNKEENVIKKVVPIL